MIKPTIGCSVTGFTADNNNVDDALFPQRSRWRFSSSAAAAAAAAATSLLRSYREARSKLRANLRSLGLQ